MAELNPDYNEKIDEFLNKEIETMNRVLDTMCGLCDEIDAVTNEVGDAVDAFVQISNVYLELRSKRIWFK